MLAQVSNWQQWFRLLGRQEPTDAQMTDLLRWCWKDGAAKGYHKAGMDYSRIQAGGVSRILLKGQSYGLPPAAKQGKTARSAQYLRVVAPWAGALGHAAVPQVLC